MNKKITASIEHKINSNLLFMALLSLLATAAIFIFTFYGASKDQAREYIMAYTSAIADGYELSGYNNDILASGMDSDLRITVIDSYGKVLFDNFAPETSENHLSRPEVQSAIKDGVGEDSRASSTLNYRSYYYAVRLDNGNILRTSTIVSSLYTIFNNALPGILAVVVLILLLSITISVTLTKSIVKPINKMVLELDDIGSDIPYKELQPLAEEIIRDRDARQKAERARQEFTANVTHELKTPLTSISGYSEMIENGMAGENDTVRFASIIRREAARLISLISDILKLSDIEENEQEETFTFVDLYATAKEAASSLSLTAANAGVNIELYGSESYVSGNERQLYELVYNLVDNAIRYNKPGGSVLVSISGKTLTVSDTGIGISKEHQEHIFERFYRVDKSRSKDTGGTGLGLAIVKHIAQSHGADISINSTLGSGTEIRVKFT